jgi:hypothetical protein
MAHSVRREKYRAAAERLERQGPVVPFTLPPQTVVKRLIHALESPRPKPRYYVTFHTYLMAVLRRLCPTRSAWTPWSWPCAARKIADPVWAMRALPPCADRDNMVYHDRLSRPNREHEHGKTRYRQ